MSWSSRIARGSLSLCILATGCASHLPPVRKPPRRVASPQPSPPPESDLLERAERRPRDLGKEEIPDDGVVRAIAAVLAEDDGGRREAPRVRWDKKSSPKYLDVVTERYGLTAKERAMLYESGMVVLSRVQFPSFGEAMHEIHRQELPLFVSADAVLQAVFRSHEATLLAAERVAADRIAEILDKAHATLGGEAKGKRYDADAAKDADLFLGVARSLLSGSAVPSLFGQEKEIEAIVERARAAEGIGEVTLFGRPRRVDFSFYEPRGVYLDAPALHDYFRAMVWLTRLEMNLVSRGSQSSAPTLTTAETPREAELAVVLADLVERSGVGPDVEKIDAYARALAGPREDVSLSALTRFAKASAISLKDPRAAQAALATAIGHGYTRTVNHHVMPTGTAEGSLPVITTFLGVSIPADSKAIVTLVPSDAPVPHVPRGPELGYLMGADAGMFYLDPTGSPGLLRRARGDLERGLGGKDLHATWIDLVRGATRAPQGVVPSFVGTRAAADRRVAIGMAGYAQIHHAHVLHTAQVYDFAGCEIPDAYVEPVVGALDFAVTYAERLALAAEKLPHHDADEARSLASDAGRLAETARVLRKIAKNELEGHAASPKELAFLRMVAEYVPALRGYTATEPGRYNGWYPRMHTSRASAFEQVPYSVDYFTSTRKHEVAFVGEGSPVLGVFVVDTGGDPRVMVGPVSRAFDRVRPLGRRVLVADADDDQPKGSPIVSTPALAAHEKSFVAPLATVPGVDATVTDDAVTVTNDKAFAGGTFELVGPHGETLARAVVPKIAARPRRPGHEDDDAVPAEELKEVRVPFVPEKGKRTGEPSTYRLRLGNGEVWTSRGMGVGLEYDTH